MHASLNAVMGVMNINLDNRLDSYRLYLHTPQAVSLELVQRVQFFYDM